MNRKGQALIEFVLILPIFLMILFAIVDFGTLLYSKNQLENMSADIVRLVLKEEEEKNISVIYPDVDINMEKYQEKYQKIIISKKVKIITPFLDRVLGNPTIIQVEWVIPNVE